MGRIYFSGILKNSKISEIMYAYTVVFKSLIYIEFI